MYYLWRFICANTQKIVLPLDFRVYMWYDIKVVRDVTY